MSTPRPGNQRTGGAATGSADLPGWSELRHGGLLLDAQRLSEVAALPAPVAPDAWLQSELRRRSELLRDADANRQRREAPEFVAFVLERLCGFGTSGSAGADGGSWLRGTRVPAKWRRRATTGESVRPRKLWLGPNGAVLPVFVTNDKRVGIGRGRRETSRVLGWLRAGPERLALVTNGRQWRLLFAGLDFDAWCEWDADLWFAEGEPSPALKALVTLIRPALWTPDEEGADPPLLRAVRDSRKGQSELSEALGERVREAVELLIQSHGDALKRDCATVDPADIYRAACRVVMRLVVILFAEARGLLPRDDAAYHAAYGLGGLHEALGRRAAAGRSQAHSYGAWPRLLALFNLVREGSHHEGLPVTAYGGDLFAPGSPDSEDGLSRALAVFETACLRDEVLSDAEVHDLLERLTRTQVRIRHGKASRLVAAPVDFSDLSTEYIGVLYEGLLDYELKTAPSDDPVIFLAVGEQPALPLSRLEAMDDKALRSLFSAFKKATGNKDSAPVEEAADAPPLGAPASSPTSGATPQSGAPATSAETLEPARPTDDPRQATRTRAEAWARHAALTAGLAKKPRRSKSQTTLLSTRQTHEQELAKRAASLVNRVVLPGEWYLVRWGGTRKGSGSFYTRPGLTVPTVQRTLRPLAYDPPAGADNEPDRGAPPAEWTPKLPEEILDLKVCDPACGSGSFPLAALRFLTEALYASVQHHRRIENQESRALVRLLGLDGAPTAGAPVPTEHPGDELIPCPPDADDFEPRLKAVLRRYVVERCIYGVDLDPLAVSLCQLSLWIETMDRDLPFSFLDHKIRCGNSLVGAWFDQFQHYPAMAWKNREAGDKTHSNGVHHEKGAGTKAIKAFVKNELTPDLRHVLEGRTLFHEDLLEQATAVHQQALESLEHMHRLPIQDSAARARLYREELLGAAEWRSLKQAMDLWCACWFWAADELDRAPLPTTFADPPAETRAAADRIAAEMRFFHWELEFPDVFREPGAGFDAMLGNPPWETLQPSSMEYFSNIDPLYRSYGKQEALRHQTAYFETAATEHDWLDYNGRFASFSNWMKLAGRPFGDPDSSDKSTNRFAVARGRQNMHLHERWRQSRSQAVGFSDPEHPFVHRGEGKAHTYKLFLEAAHALLACGGRLGLVVPSGLYSDQGTGPLRDLFLERCSWEWLFGFENRARLFPIHRSYKFNPVIVQKGGTTQAIRTVFMRRDLTDWEQAEEIAVPYRREHVLQFSPKSRAILEIESSRDLQILEKIYKNSVLLGDDTPDGWGINYAQGDFNMTSDSRLFPRRPVWEAKRYRPDEYSRWLLGNWRPIEELWAELGIDPADHEAVAIDLEDWLFDSDAGPERRMAERQFVHGHLLAPGDLDRHRWEARCAQQPYDRLPVPRVAIPEGIILSREADAWIDEAEVKDVALPLYQGIMIQPFMPSARGWLSGTGLRAKWDYNTPSSLVWNPQYLMHSETAQGALRTQTGRVGFRDISRNTDARSFAGAILPAFPCGHSVPVLRACTTESSPRTLLHVGILLNSLAFDWQLRRRVGGTHLTWHLLQETALPLRSAAGDGPFEALSTIMNRINLFPKVCAPLRLEQGSLNAPDAQCPAERLRLRAMADAISTKLFGCDATDLRHLLHDTDLPCASIKTLSSHQNRLDARGFWRVDRDKPPEVRHTVLTQIAFADLQRHINAAAGDVKAGIQTFMDQNQGDGWLLPEALRLADYDLGHDDRAKKHQPVATELGPRFYDWQLAQPPDEAWAETHLHARNLLGEHGYHRLVTELEQRQTKQPPTLLQPISEVAEKHHRWDNWLYRTHQERKRPRMKGPDQKGLFR